MKLNKQSKHYFFPYLVLALAAAALVASSVCFVVVASQYQQEETDLQSSYTANYLTTNSSQICNS